MLAEQIERAKQLRVLFADSGGALVVDAEALMRTANDVRYWTLVPDSDVPGWWRHPESSERGPLFEHLRAIACCYELLPDGTHG